MKNTARRRVVVTGLGMVTPLGLTVASTWEGIVAGKSGIGTITRFDTTGLEIFVGRCENGSPCAHRNEPRKNSFATFRRRPS